MMLLMMIGRVMSLLQMQCLILAMQMDSMVFLINRHHKRRSYFPFILKLPERLRAGNSRRKSKTKKTHKWKYSLVLHLQSVHTKSLHGSVWAQSAFFRFLCLLVFISSIIVAGSSFAFSAIFFRQCIHSMPLSQFFCPLILFSIHMKKKIVCLLKKRTSFKSQC